MPKFTFIGEHSNIYGKPDGTKITYEFTVDTLSDILEHTDLFVRGCGYTPPPGVLDYVNDEPHEWQTEEFETPVEKHSGFYYDKDRNK